MGKYDALGVFLRRWKVRNEADGVELGFRSGIEQSVVFEHV